MAGTMVHLVVAEKLLKFLSHKKWSYPFDNELVMNADYFVAGNICPDGIMAREGYERSMKLHSHFRDDIPDGSFDKPGMIPIFEKRMCEFWREHQEEEREYPGLYLGYITHMMTDERFILKERPKFFQNIAPTGLTQKDRETFVRFNKETDLVDFQLIREYPELQKARESLERVPEYEIRGMITRDELTTSRKWILHHFFETEHTEETAEFLEYDSMVRFIEEITKEIGKRLFEEGYLKK